VEIGIWVVVAAAVVGGIVWSYHQKQKRRQELASMARQLGLEYSPQDSQGCIGLPFALLQRGDGRGTENVLSGTWQGLPLVEFDYWYYEESRDSNGNTTRTTYRFSCAVADVGAAISPLTLGRENVFT
jgi:hypothetical protein